MSRPVLRSWSLAAALLSIASTFGFHFGASAQAPSIRDFLSAPFASDLVAAPAGGRLAWVVNDRGVRNIWIAEPPEYRGRRLTRYGADDGQEIGELAFTPDGRSVVFVRGGGRNRQGEFPNPHSDPAGVRQEIFVVGVAGGDPRRLAEGSGLAVSPKGDRVVFTRGGQVWSVPLEGGEVLQLIQARGGADSLRFSPAGTHLAFVSARGEHSFVAVYDMAAATLRFLDPSLAADSAPAWSPDGKRLAWLRIRSGPPEHVFAPRRTGEPWSIHVAAIADGQARLLWRAQPGRGSVFRDLASLDPLLWTTDDRIVFPWERDGWTHLHAVRPSGGDATLLTPGEFEVEHVALAAGGRELLYSSNQGDSDRRHIWRVAAAGGPPRSVTSGDGIEWSPVATDDGKAIAFLRSDAVRPSRPAVLPAGGAPRDLAPVSLPAALPTSAMVVPQAVVFKATDGQDIRAQLFLPKGLAPADKRPALAFFHGGSRRQMLLGWHYMAYYHGTYAMNQYLASRGYIVLAVNFRSGIGYGLDFREATGFGAAGASEVNDVLGAGQYLRSRPDVDPARVGLWGGSYGGYLTAFGLARGSDLFAAGADLHGVHDWVTWMRWLRPDYEQLVAPEAVRLARESSPLAHVAGWKSPVLLIHGDDDRNVPFEESVALVRALRARGIETEELVLPDEVHDFLVHENWVRSYEAVARFFERKLARAK